MINIKATRGKKMLRRFIAAVAVATAVTTTSIPVFAAEAPNNPKQGQIAHNNVAAFMQANMQSLVQQILAGDYTYFDPIAYLQANPELAKQFGGNIMAAINHYFTIGALEGRASMGRVDLVAIIVSHPECVASGKLDVASVVTAFAKATGQSIESVTTKGIVIGSTANGALGVASIAPDSPAAATTKVSTGMIFTGGAATNPATNNGGDKSESSSTDSSASSSDSSDGSSDSSDSSSDDDDNHNLSKQSFDDFVATIPMAEHFSTFAEYDAALDAWTQAGLALGYMVATPGGTYEYELTETAWFDVPAYIQEQSTWLKTKPTAEYILKQAGYYNALEVWETGKPDASDYSYSAVAYQTALNNWEDTKPTYEEYMSELDLASFDEDMDDWEASKPQATDYLYDENPTYATEFQAKAAWAAHVKNKFASLRISDFTGVYPTWAEYAPYVEAPAAWTGYTSEENAAAGYQSDMNAWAAAVQGIRFEHAIDNYDYWKLRSVPSGIDTTDDIAMARAYIAYLGSFTDKEQAEVIAEKLRNSAYIEPNAENYVFDAAGYAAYTAAVEARAAYEAYEAYRSGVNTYKDEVDTYIGQAVSEYKTAITTNAGNAINNLDTYDYNKYSSQAEANAAYALACDAWEGLKPEPANYITNQTQRTNYGNAIAAWEGRKPDMAAFIGEDGTFDETNYNAALEVWRSKGPDVAEYLTDADKREYADALIDWKTNKPHSVDYVYSDEYYANEAAAQAAKDADLAAYNARQALTVTAGTVYNIDGKNYTDAEAAEAALTAYKAKMTAANAEIKNLTLDNCKTTYWYFGGQRYDNKEAATSAFATFNTTQTELAKTVSNYKNSVVTYSFGGQVFDQADAEAYEAFATYCAKQNAKIAITALGKTDAELTSFKNTGDFYKIYDKYYLVGNADEEKAAAIALEKMSKEQEETFSLADVKYPGLHYWEFAADTYGEFKRLIKTSSKTPDDTFLAEEIVKWQTGNEPDGKYVESKGVNANAYINDFTDSRDNWTVNGTSYTTETDAEAAMNAYHESLGTVDAGWSAEKTVTDFENVTYIIGGVEYTTNETATTALEDYKNSHVVDPDYDEEKVLSGYGDTKYTYEGSETYYASEEAARMALAEYKAGVTDPETKSYDYNKYASAEATRAAYEADLNAYVNANHKPTPSDYASEEAYRVASAAWNAAKPAENDYVRDLVAEDELEEATGNYVSTHPAPNADDYAQFTDPNGDHYVDIDGAQQSWSEAKPEKDDFLCESDDDDES